MIALALALAFLGCLAFAAFYLHLVEKRPAVPKDEARILSLEQKIDALESRVGKVEWAGGVRVQGR